MTMGWASKTLTIFNILLVVFLAAVWHRCNQLLLDPEKWIQCHDNKYGSHGNRQDGGHETDPHDPIVTKLGGLKGGTSVWCRGNNNTDRTCHFHNLCFSPMNNTFLFIHASNTIISGVPNDRYSPALLDLSSVPNHNTQYFHYTDVPADRLYHFKRVALYRGVHFMFNRFNPSNLMHVFHDDLLPLFYTLLQLGLLDLDTSTSTARLVFLEGWKEGEYFDTYGWLSRGCPLMKDALLKHGNDTLVCFSDAFLGLSKETTWYQYGFDEPQGPLVKSKVKALQIRTFTAAFGQSLQSAPSEHEDGVKGQSPGQHEVKVQRQACLFTRDSNRLILNEGDVISTIAQVSGLTTVKISLDDLLSVLYPYIDKSDADDFNPDMDPRSADLDQETPNVHGKDSNLEVKEYISGQYKISLRMFIENVRTCKLVVGMHGSLLAMIMFLLPGSTVVELFPYAVNPDHYTPYKTLANIPGMRIAYKAWRNNIPENTVTHVDAAPEQGGILHLSLEEQQRILGSREVPRHLCCSDPEWLFRIYQDTIVDIPSFHAVLLSALEESQHNLRQDAIPMSSFEANALPGVIQKAQCKRTTSDDVFGIQLSWQPPWNIQFFENADIKYEVWIQSVEQDDYKAWVLEMTEYVFTEGLNMNTQYKAWIRCLVGDRKGPFISVHQC